MGRLGVWGVAATLALGLAGARGAAADGDTPPGAGLTGGMFARSAAQGKKLGPDEEAARQAVSRASAREARRKRQEEQARADVLRRLAVCDRLEELADPALAEKVARLRDRAWQLYLKKTERQPAGDEADAQEKAPAPKPAAEGPRPKDTPPGRPFRASHPWRTTP